MKKYPYTDSTELIMYEPKKKKEHKWKKYMPCVMSAVLASTITLGAAGVGGYYYLKPIKDMRALMYQRQKHHREQAVR